MMLATESLAKEVRIKRVCEALGIPRASYYYYHKNINRKRVPIKAASGSLYFGRTKSTLDTLHTERF